MARILIVHPGPDFSVADVHRGWEKALRALGHTVMNYNTNDRITYFGHSRMPERDKPVCEACEQVPTRQALDNTGIIQLAMDGLYETCFKFWPDVVFFVSGFYVTAPLLTMLRARNMKIVFLHTESPYQDDEQLVRGEFADLNLVNDPVNIEAWKDLDVPVAYAPHSYDPEVHYPDWRPDRFEADFAFIGTLFKTRAQFFSQMDFTGVDATFGGGGWDVAVHDYPELVNTVVDRDKGHRLIDYLGHDADHCVDNTETARVYRTSRVGINFYRRESEDAHQGEGWAMGPREVEMAACGLFFLRDPRPESDDVFGDPRTPRRLPGHHAVLPAFHSPEEASEQLRWWLDHPALREKRAQDAYERIENRTFENSAKSVLHLMEEAGIL